MSFCSSDYLAKEGFDANWSTPSTTTSRQELRQLEDTYAMLFCSRWSAQNSLKIGVGVFQITIFEIRIAWRRYVVNDKFEGPSLEER